MNLDKNTDERSNNLAYRAPFWMVNPHIETIVPAVFRTVIFNNYERERIDTPDGDFLDLDWSLGGNHTLIILCHGLEGNSRRPYMKGMAKKLNQDGFDVLSWNYRGCSGEVNRKVRAYHSGATDDLDTLIQYSIGTGRYQQIGLIGFSLGGNMVLKYLGEEWDSKRWVQAGVALSVPTDLAGSSLEIKKPTNWLYTTSFLTTLKKKLKEKAALFPGELDISPLGKISNLIEFDDQYTAPIHGFKDANDYYAQCNSGRFLESIDRPALIINAKNDTFLSESCYPEEAVRKHKHLQLRIPTRGGHVGFSSRSGFGTYWSEDIVSQFLKEKLAV